MPIHEREPLPDPILLKFARNTLPLYGRELFLSVHAADSHIREAENAYWNENQRRMKRIQEAKYRRDKALSDDERERFEAEIAAEQAADEEMKKSRNLRNSQLLGVRPEGLKLALSGLIRSKKAIRQHRESLPEQSVEADISEVAAIREKVGAKTAEITAIERAYLPDKEIMQRLDRDLNNFYAAGAPDLRQISRAVDNGDGQYRFGKAEWPRAYAGNDHFVSDGLSFVFWLFRDEIRKRLEAEVKAITKGRKIAPVAERPSLIKKLRQEILSLEFYEGALMARIHAAERIDIHHRHNIDVRALLQIDTGTRK